MFGCLGATPILLLMLALTIECALCADVPPSEHRIVPGAFTAAECAKLGISPEIKAACEHAENAEETTELVIDRVAKQEAERAAGGSEYANSPLGKADEKEPASVTR